MAVDEQQELRERRRLVICRRLRAVQQEYGLPSLGHARTHKLSKACADVLGEEGIPDCDLRVLHRYAARGLLDRF